MLTRIYDEALRPVGLRITQFSLLRSLGRLGLATTTQLADESALDRTTISRNVKLLIESGWVDVAEGGDDKRERFLSLTRSGQKAIARAMPCFQKAQEAVERTSQRSLGGTTSDRLLKALIELQGASEARPLAGSIEAA
ncbi:MAG TPA: MarR family transcriptional regulator [Burkholderiaceae bacterium]|nr:MarR family transcriptional regulator [Burkholderiaceae bacterium]